MTDLEEDARMDPRPDPQADPQTAPQTAPEEVSGASPRVVLPRSVRVASWLLAGVIALSGVTALLTVVLRDELVRSWAEGNTSARTLLEEGGLEALEGSEIVPSFVPVALVMFVVLALLGWVLAVFFRTGHGWARWSIATLVVFAGFTSVVGLNRNLPDAFLALTVVALVLNAVLLFFCFHKDTNAFLKGL